MRVEWNEYLEDLKKSIVVESKDFERERLTREYSKWNKIDGLTIVVIILFSAFCESYINIYGRRKLDNSEFNDFEKLDLRKKWTYFPFWAGYKKIDKAKMNFMNFPKLLSLEIPLCIRKGI